MSLTILMVLFRPHVRTDVYQTVRSYTTCESNREQLERKRQFQLLSTSKPLEVFGMNTLGPLSQKENRNRSIIEKADRFSQMKTAIPMS